jgi:hypothetical protein
LAFDKESFNDFEMVAPKKQRNNAPYEGGYYGDFEAEE